MGKFQYEKAVVCFSKAITLQPEQVLEELGHRVTRVKTYCML